MASAVLCASKRTGTSFKIATTPMAEALPETGTDKVELGYVRDVRVRLPKLQ